MPLGIDDITRRRLLLCRQFFNHALLQSGNPHSVVQRILSIVGFDLAVETVLKAAALAIDPQKTPADSFQALIQQVDALLPTIGVSGLSDKPNLQFIHSLRNDAQHKAKHPSETDLVDARSFAKRFLIRFLVDVWGMPFEGLSLTTVIRDADVKNDLEQAEAALAGGNYPEAVKHAAAGFTWALLGSQELIVGPRVMVGITRPGGFPPEYRESLWRTQECVLALATGLDLTELARFRAIAPYVSFLADGRRTPYIPNLNLGITKDEADFVVTFAVNAVAQIEERTAGLRPRSSGGTQQAGTTP